MHDSSEVVAIAFVLIVLGLVGFLFYVSINELSAMLSAIDASLIAQ